MMRGPVDLADGLWQSRFLKTHHARYLLFSNQIALASAEGGSTTTEQVLIAVYSVRVKD